MWRHAKASFSQHCQKKKVFSACVNKFMFMKRQYQKLDMFPGFLNKADELNDPLLSNDFSNIEGDDSSECSDTHTTDTEY